MGTLTLAEMETELYLLMDSRDEVDPTVPAGVVRCDRFLNWSYRRTQLPSVFEHTAVQTTQSIVLVTGTSSYALTIRAIDHVRYENVDKRLKPRTRMQLSEKTIPSGPPTLYSHWGNLVYLDYIPTSTENGHILTVYGWAQPIALATNPASILDTEWDEVIVTGAAWRGWRSLGDMARADVYREEYAALVNDNRNVLTIEAHDSDWRASIGGDMEYQ